MATENFTTYTEVEEVADIFSVAAGKIDFSNVPLDETSYVYKDFSAGHFGDFEHKVTVYLSDVNEGSSTSLCGLGQSNELTVFPLHTGDGLSTNIRGQDSVSLRDIRILEIDGGSEGASDLGVILVNTIYYLTISRSGTTYQTLVYDDSGRTNLIHTLSITCIATTFRYNMAAETGDYGANGGRRITGYIENLDLQEGAPAGNAPTSALWGPLGGALYGPIQ